MRYYERYMSYYQTSNDSLEKLTNGYGRNLRCLFHVWRAAECSLQPAVCIGLSWRCEHPQKSPNPSFHSGSTLFVMFLLQGRKRELQNMQSDLSCVELVIPMRHSFIGVLFIFLALFRHLIFFLFFRVILILLYRA